MLTTAKYGGVIKFKKLYSSVPMVSRLHIKNRLIHLKEALPYTSENLLHKIYESAISKCWNECSALAEDDGWTAHHINYSRNRYFTKDKTK